MTSKWTQSGTLNFADDATFASSDYNTTIEQGNLPIGSVIAWHKSITGAPATMPGCWVECNGQTLSDSDSPLDGQTLPNLNGNNNFLRCATTSGGTGGTATHSHTVTGGSIAINAGASTNAGITAGSFGTGATSSLPIYMNCVWIVRIK